MSVVSGGLEAALRFGFLVSSLQKRSVEGDFAAASAGDAVRTSTPLFVIKSVCSHCAERLPSRVTTVQPSAHISDFGDLV